MDEAKKQADELGRRVMARLRFIMKKKKPVDISEASGISTSYIYRLMNPESDTDKNPTIDVIDRIARACGSNLAEVFAPWAEPAKPKSAKSIEAENLEASSYLDVLLADPSLRTGVIDMLENLAAPLTKGAHKASLRKNVKP